MLEENKVRFVGRDLNFTIGLSTNANLGGLSQDIDSFIETETGLSINPAPDGEKLKYLPTVPLTYTFYFYNTNTSSYATSLLNAGFTYNELVTVSTNLRKSFYLFQVYTSTATETQVLLHNGYYNGFTFYSGNTSYNILPSAEVSGYYLTDDQLSLIVNNTVYLKLGFYNAKTGKFQLFYNDAKAAGTTEDKLYFDVTVDIDNMTYSTTSPLVAREFANATYINKLNENVPSFSYQSPVYPSGGTALSGNTYFTP